MESKKLILVTGATGGQGGSVVKALLASGKYAIRALTRNASSPKAIALKNAGVEVVEGNMENMDSLLAAMKGCYGVYGVTSFWEHYDAEYEHGRNLVTAVKQSNIEHFVLHTLPSYYKLTNGQYSVPHFDMKAAMQEYAKSLQLKATFLHIAFYYENFFQFTPLQLADDSSLFFGFPQGDTKFSMVSVEDVGGIVATIFDHPAEYIGRTVGAVGSDDTCHEYAATMSRVFGRKVNYVFIPREVFAAFDFPGAEELANMFEVQRLYVPNRQLDLIESYGLNPNMQTFEAWLQKNKEAFIAIFSTLELKAQTM